MTELVHDEQRAERAVQQHFGLPAHAEEGAAAAGDDVDEPLVVGEPEPAAGGRRACRAADGRRDPYLPPLVGAARRRRQHAQPRSHFAAKVDLAVGGATKERICFGEDHASHVLGLERRRAPGGEDGEDPLLARDRLDRRGGAEREKRSDQHRGRDAEHPCDDNSADGAKPRSLL
jgi:hypothetical protein